MARGDPPIAGSTSPVRPAAAPATVRCCEAPCPALAGTGEYRRDRCAGAAPQPGRLPTRHRQARDPRRRGSKPLAWDVLDEAGSVVARGQSVPFGPDAASGDTVQQIDFAAVRTPGTYRLRIDGRVSHAFAVAPDIYRPLARAALNFFYQQRAGTPIEARFAGGAEWARAAGHSKEVVSCFKGTDQSGTVWPGCPYTLDVTGGWYDAGDHGKYVVNGGISLWMLQNLYEANAVAPPFADGSAALPEAGNGINDLLDETRWEMRFLLSMQVPQGQTLSLPVGRQGRGPYRLTPVDAGAWRITRSPTATGPPCPLPPPTTARSGCSIRPAPPRR
ncbi:glycoside hydrolase family 9 protein [Sphingomonas sp. I4]